MSSNIVLPDLQNFVEGRISAIYAAKTAEDFESAFDDFVSQHASIHVNGKQMSRAEYKALLQGQTAADTSAGISGSVTFSDVDAIPVEGNVDAIGTGFVALRFKAIVFGRFFVFAHRESSTISSSMHVVVKEDVKRPHQIGFGGGFDGRRATVINELFTEKVNPAAPVSTKPSS
ncbi:hypothetical protein C2E23DRAFT_882269 [Lenzites betulinus]|nr:hypothetical protein C2E23DRAFT_882269 [Lenzites betulinus]